MFNWRSRVSEHVWMSSWVFRVCKCQGSVSCDTCQSVQQHETWPQDEHWLRPQEQGKDSQNTRSRSQRWQRTDESGLWSALNKYLVCNNVLYEALNEFLCSILNLVATQKDVNISSPLVSSWKVDFLVIWDVSWSLQDWWWHVNNEHRSEVGKIQSNWVVPSWIFCLFPESCCRASYPYIWREIVRVCVHLPPISNAQFRASVTLWPQKVLFSLSFAHYFMLSKWYFAF